jgi:thioredoxin-like negative regulator of GroEL
MKFLAWDVGIKNLAYSVIDYDIDEAYSEATQYGIRSVPTVIIEKNGVEVERFTGTSSKMAYVNAINECIN